MPVSRQPAPIAIRDPSADPVSIDDSDTLNRPSGSTQTHDQLVVVPAEVCFRSKVWPRSQATVAMKARTGARNGKAQPSARAMVKNTSALTSFTVSGGARGG